MERPWNGRNIKKDGGLTEEQRTLEEGLLERPTLLDDDDSFLVLTIYIILIHDTSNLSMTPWKSEPIQDSQNKTNNWTHVLC